MDFHSLSRRELQALCKRNKIPANLSNIAMADSLKSLATVEGIDQILLACKSETMDVASPFVPPTGLLTPAQFGVTSRRRRAAKEDSAVRQVYGTRRSERLAKKSGTLQRGVAEFSKKDLFTTGGGEEFKMNLDEILDGSSELSGVTAAEESVSKDEGQVDSCDKQAVSTGVKQAPAVEEEMSNHSEIEGALSGIIDTSASKEEGQVDSGDKKAVSTDVEQAPVVEEEVRNHSEDDGSESRVKEDVVAKMSVEVKFDEKDESKAEEVKLVADIEEDHYPTGADSKIELNESTAAEFEQDGSVTEEFGDCSDTKAYHDETLVLALAVNSDDEALKADGSHAIGTTVGMQEKTAEDAELVDKTLTENEVDLSFNTFIHSDYKQLCDADSNPHGVVAFDENEENLELNTAKLDVAMEDHPEDHPTHQLAAFMENEANPSFAFQTAFSTPKRASASKAYSRMNRAAAASDNKENVGNGSKSAPAKAKLKMVNEFAEDEPSLLSKNFKDLAITTQSLDKSEGENGANARIALQELPDNQKGK